MVTEPNTLLQSAHQDGVASAIQAAVVGPGLRWEAQLGACWPGGPEVVAETRFDLASVTKAAATTLVGLVLAGRGALDLDAPLGRFTGRAHHQAVPLRAMFGHRSGLRAWSPLFAAAREHPGCRGLYPGQTGGVDRALARALTVEAALAVPPEAPVNDARVYSDLNFILLGELLGQLAGQRLDAAFEALVAGPLGLAHTGFCPIGEGEPPEAPLTGVWRPREPAPGQEGLYAVPPQAPTLRPGEVDDDNAWAMGGVAGHAGLFGTAADLARLGQLLLEELGGAGRLAPAPVVAEWLSVDAPELLPRRSLGFDRPSGPGSTAGPRLGVGPRGGVGHLGFVGAGWWIDLDRGLSCALLTNRTFPTRANTLGIRALRPAFFDACVDLVESR